MTTLTGSQELVLPQGADKSPLDDIFVDYLMARKRESPELDFKLLLDISRQRFASVAKDLFAMANYGGGWILAGFKEKETGGFELEGLPPNFHIDQAELQQKFNAYASDPLSVGYREFERVIEGENRRFAIINVPPSTSPLYPKNDGIVRLRDGKEKKVFRQGEILFRRGTQSITASDTEREFIRCRAEQADYQISLISGTPDRIEERLYSNLFQVLKCPEHVFAAKVTVDQVPFSAELATPFVFQHPWMYTFDNPTNGPLDSFIEKGIVQKHRVDEWLLDEDRRKLVLWLLDSLLLWHARKLGMYRAKRKKLFFPLREGESVRSESWPGMARDSIRHAAWMMYSEQLHETVGVHPAADVHFLMIADRLYMQLSPTYVLTWDGRHVRRGEEEGAFITRLSYDEYNKLYLRNLLFWMSKLSGSRYSLQLLNGQIEIDAQPMKAHMPVGIRSDLPPLELLGAQGTPPEGDG